MKTSWTCLEEIFAIRFEDVLKTSSRCLQNVFKTSWRFLEDIFARRLEDFLRTIWRCLEDIWPRWIYSPWSRRLEDLLETSCKDVWLRQLFSPWSRRLEDIFWRRRRKRSSTDPYQDQYLLGLNDWWECFLCILTITIQVTIKVIRKSWLGISIGIDIGNDTRIYAQSFHGINHL